MEAGGEGSVGAREGWGQGKGSVGVEGEGSVGAGEGWWETGRVRGVWGLGEECGGGEWGLDEWRVGAG